MDSQDFKFKSGQEVRLRSERDRLGVIMGSPRLLAGEYWYRVNFGGGNIENHPESNLEAYEGDRSIIDLLTNGVYGNRETLSKLITFTKIRFPLRKNIYSFKASRTEFHEYQFKPVLKFIDSQDHRLLIADEVGLGKTIEAGYILQEQKARWEMDRVLIVCPASLVEKWRQELDGKFHEEFELLRASDIRDFLNKIAQTGEATKLRGICSLQMLRGRGLLEDWEAASPPLDMVIIDEGHHMRNPGTRNHRLGLALSETADAMLMLTATPVHLGNQDLFYLLRILNPEEFESLEIFGRRVRANRMVLRALSLLGRSPVDLGEVGQILADMKSHDDAQWFEKNPIYHDVSSRIREVDPQNKEQIVELQRDLNSLNLLGHILTRTRKRDVQVKAKRDPHIIRPQFTDVEMAFYEAVTNFVISQYGQKGLGVFGRFIAVMPQRQVASCIPAMVEYYTSELLGGGLGGLDEEMSDVVVEDYEEDLPDSDRPATSEYYSLLNLIKSRTLKGVDSKFDALLKTLNELDEVEPGRQVLIFSYFKKTLGYLSQKLNHAGYKHVLISGDLPREERNRKIDQFRNDKAVRIMLSSEVGSEGLDFQFCHIMVNYDLPWNPMVVEQRIGRLDRIGQKSDRILIFNFSIAGTIEDKILHRLYYRIGIFEESIGDLEAILGEEIRQLTRDLLTSKLSPEEQEERINHAAEVIIRKQKEQAELEAQSAKFIGNDEFFMAEIERIKQHKRFISPEELVVFFKDFMDKNFPRCSFKAGRSPFVFSLSINDEFMTFLRQNLPEGDTGFRQFIRKSARETIQVTFSSEEAFENPELEFINISHPIIRTIGAYYENHREELHPVARINLNSENFSNGDYLYMVYLLEVKAARSFRSLETIFVSYRDAVSIGEELSEDLVNEMITNGETLDPFPRPSPDTNKRVTQVAEDEFGKRIEKKRLEIERINEALISSRMASLEQSFKAKKQKREELLDRAKAKVVAPQYIRMLDGGLRNLKMTHELKKQELEDAKKIYVSFNQVCAGFLRINNVQKNN